MSKLEARDRLHEHMFRMHQQGMTWSQIGEFFGRRGPSIKRSIQIWIAKHGQDYQHSEDGPRKVEGVGKGSNLQRS